MSRALYCSIYTLGDEGRVGLLAGVFRHTGTRSGTRTFSNVYFGVAGSVQFRGEKIKSHESLVPTPYFGIVPFREIIFLKKRVLCKKN